MKMLRMGSLGKKREGFTLIELLIVMVILAILAGIVIISIGGVIGRGQATAYNADREQIEAAVAEFMTRPTDLVTQNHTIGEVPKQGYAGAAISGATVNGADVIPTETYFPIAMCALTTNAFPKGILKNLPSTAHADNLATGGANDEAFGADNLSCLDIATDGSYKWYTTDAGDCISVCIGADCTHSAAADGELWDGFQDVYP